jgi:hypothetical protein
MEVGALPRTQTREVLRPGSRPRRDGRQPTPLAAVSVEVQPSEAIAAQNLAAVRTARGLACLKRSVPQSLAKGGAGSGSRFGAPTVSRLPTFPGGR